MVLLTINHTKVMRLTQGAHSINILKLNLHTFFISLSRFFKNLINGPAYKKIVSNKFIPKCYHSAS